MRGRVMIISRFYTEMDGGAVAGIATSPLPLPFVTRYSRQLLAPSFGPAAQLALSSARILIVGAGGLGSTACMYLAGAGVGVIGVCDGDIVEECNLHRQIMHSNADVGVLKVSSAANAMRSLNPHITVVEHPVHMTSSNAASIIGGYDAVVDAVDNVQARLLISDNAVAAGKPVISGAAVGVDGTISVLNHKAGPCYRCLHGKVSHALIAPIF